MISRREQMRQLPPLRIPLPHTGAENCKDGPYLQEQCQLDRARPSTEIYRQAESGGVLLSSMGNPQAHARVLG